MADYMHLRIQRDAFIHQYKEALQAATARYDSLKSAALNIQRVYRGVVDREIISKKK